MTTTDRPAPDTPIPHRRPRVPLPGPTDAERLRARLDRGESPDRTAGSGLGRLTAGPSRSIVHRLLGRIASDELVLTDPDGRTTRFGPTGGGPRRATDPGLQPLGASIDVADERAFAAVLRDGSAGLGRGYIERWWDTDDPVAVIRVLIRNLHGLDDVRNRIDRVTGRFGDAARRLAPRSNLRRRNRDDIGAHYDIGNSFFRLFLDETMTYSAAVFDGSPSVGGDGDRDGDLRAASLAKYDRLLTKLGVREDHRLLEIGTGWGGMAIRTAETTGAAVTTTTVSREQYAEARARVAASPAASRIAVLDDDWRDLRGRHDRVVSIEMIEAVDWRDYDRFFAQIERCLEPTGMVGLQAICVPDRRFARAKKTEDFIRRFVFPGGYLPSIGAIAAAVGRATRLQILDVEDLSAHYAATLQAWSDRFERRLDEVLALGLDERFCRLWRFYLAYCQAGFLERHCTVNQIVLVGPDWRPDGLALRPC